MLTTEEQIYISAVRYGLGRQTYITEVISDFMIEKSKTLSEHCKTIMIIDIERLEKRYELGADCDKESWLKLLKELK